jgi:CRISPR/Cas system CSM-associated protein Csm3 (group 7 of RAMP superfamily)
LKKPQEVEVNILARKIFQRIYITGDLVTESPLHVGGLSLDPTIDLALAIDGRGRLYIPGTSLAGALKNAVKHQDLWGYQDKNQGHASFLVIEDVYVSQENIVITEVRDGVQIDRGSGTATIRGKFDRAIIPKGVKLDMKLSLDLPLDENSQTAYTESLDHILGALAAGEIRLGAAKTRGLGRVKLENCQRLVHELRTKTGILAALLNTADNTQSYSEYTPKKFQAPNQLQVKIIWKPVGAVLVKDSIESNAVDVLPLTSADGSNLALVIPGSSIKGALRSQAERIVSTLCPDIDSGDELPIVPSLFGTTANKEKPQLGQGALFVEDCYSQKQSTRAAWQKVLQADKDSNLIDVLSNANMATVQQAFHVAIDRWTGGAAEHMLYSKLEPFGINWSPIELSVNLNRLASDSLVGIALLLFLLRDLAQQRIPLGYGVNRGLGAIKVEEIQINGRGLVPDSPDFSWLIDARGTFQDIDPLLLANLDTDWNSIITRYQPYSKGMK